MKNILDRLFPKFADNQSYTGNRIAAYVFLVIALIGCIRSLIHLFAPDGGAASIAGMDLTVSDAEGIVFAFSLWGSAQLLYGLIQLIVFLRYKNLIPLMYALILLEIGLRMLVGQIKPVTFAHTPPGQIGNFVMIPLALTMLLLSLRRNRKSNNR